VLTIRLYQENGLSFIRSPQDTRNLKFDGKDYPVAGRGVAEGSTSSARRVDDRTLEITDKINGKITKTEQRKLSPDLKTLIRTMRALSARMRRTSSCLRGSRSPSMWPICLRNLLKSLFLRRESEFVIRIASAEMLGSRRTVAALAIETVILGRGPRSRSFLALPAFVCAGQ
jgi:hypothetical protein